MSPWMLGLIMRKRELVTETFTSNHTWIAPATTSKIESMTGEGADGAAAVYAQDTIDLILVSPISGQSGGATISRSSAIATGALEWDKFDGSGTRTVSYVRTSYLVGPDNLVQTTTTSRSANVRGTKGDLSTSSTTGNITYDNATATFCRGVIDVRQSVGTTGASTTGFGKTFAGGIETAATPVTYTNEPVTPAASYTLVIPAGGSLSITYYR